MMYVVLVIDSLMIIIFVCIHVCISVGTQGFYMGGVDMITLTYVTVCWNFSQPISIAIHIFGCIYFISYK